MDGNTDCAGLVGDGTGDGLTNPPGGVGGELVAFGVVEFFHGFDEPQVSFLNQVQELHAAAHIALGDGYHQTQVGFGQLLFGSFVAFGHFLSQIDLFIGAEQRHFANFLQIHAHGIVDAEVIHQCIGIDQFFLFDFCDLLQGRIRVVNGFGQIIVAGRIDAQQLEGIVDAVHLVAFQIHIVQHFRKLGRVELSFFAPFDEQVAQFFAGLDNGGSRQGGDHFLVQFAGQLRFDFGGVFFGFIGCICTQFCLFCISGRFFHGTLFDCILFCRIFLSGGSLFGAVLDALCFHFLHGCLDLCGTALIAGRFLCISHSVFLHTVFSLYFSQWLRSGDLLPQRGCAWPPRFEQWICSPAGPVPAMRRIPAAAGYW